MHLPIDGTMFTISHSTRSLIEFVALLRQVDVTLIVDVRAFHRSKAMPQFNADALPESLAEYGIGYRHLRALGGRRHHRKGTPPSLDAPSCVPRRCGGAVIAGSSPTTWWPLARASITSYLSASTVPSSTRPFASLRSADPLRDAIVVDRVQAMQVV